MAIGEEADMPKEGAVTIRRGGEYLFYEPLAEGT